MKLIVGKYSGFCSGVNYTYLNAEKELKKGKTYCLGEIIHNELVIKKLEDLGMVTINSLNEITDNSRVIFRAHGEPLEKYKYAKKHNLEVIDLTCPKVKLIHEKVLKANNDSFIVIIGKKNHPEIIGTSGFADDYCIIEKEEDLKDLELCFKKKKKKILIISQTTFSSSYFDYLVGKIKEILSEFEITIDKTICDATEKRQTECNEISKIATCMIVIGSKNSSNTKELFEIAKSNCNNVFFAENIDDLNEIKYLDSDTIGVVAGASTPKFLIDEIIYFIKNNSVIQ